MYSTCLFCYGDLGANEVIEHLPIGRRLAFDPAKGRLWVVCRKCERWNLTPIEERWEALEECERAFRGTKLRASTDQIALAHLREGLELVRIGQPLRPEMAAWRYGDQFGRRRRKPSLLGGGGVAAAGVVVAAGVAAGVLTGAVMANSGSFFNIARAVNGRRVRSRIHVPGEASLVALRLRQLSDVSISQEGIGRWALHVPYTLPNSEPRRLGNGRLFRPGRLGNVAAERRTVALTGDEATRVVRQLLPAINAAGAAPAAVSSAVDLLEATGDPEILFHQLASTPPTGRDRSRRKSEPLPGTPISRLPVATRLALEMITHEEAERRALEGELSQLEDAWREAEEIAGIADDMFLPESTQDELDALKRR